MLLKDQVAVVTGAGQGIGAASAKALAEAGAIVVAVDIDGALVQKMAGSLAAHQHRTLAIAADAGSVADIQRMVDRTIADYGRIDILVNNAGVTRRADIMDITEADWDRIHRVNAKGVFFCLQTVARTMIPRRSGRIINIASIAGKGYAGASNAAYAASKGAVIALTKTGSTAARQAQHQRQLHLPGRDAHGLVGCQPAGPCRAGRAHLRGHGAAPRRGHPAAARQRPRGHRGHGGVPGFAGCAQHHGPVLQRRRRPHPRLDRTDEWPLKQCGLAAGDQARATTRHFKGSLAQAQLSLP